MNNDLKKVEKIRNSYISEVKEQTDLEKLKDLDKKVKRPVNIFSYIYGTAGSLTLGTGMCLAMGVIGSVVPLGIAIGVFGIGMMLSTYPFHKRILARRKEKYAKEIIEKSNKLLSGQEISYEKYNSATKQNSIVRVQENHNTENKTNITNEYSK